jgi:hypothetical protein
VGNEWIYCKVSCTRWKKDVSGSSFSHVIGPSADEEEDEETLGVREGGRA